MGSESLKSAISEGDLHYVEKGSKEKGGEGEHDWPLRKNKSVGLDCEKNPSFKFIIGLCMKTPSFTVNSCVSCLLVRFYSVAGALPPC